MSDSSSSPGPELPPGPSLPPGPAPGPAPTPTTDASISRKRSRSPPPTPEKRQRTIGPTLPPPEQLNNNNDSNDTDDSDDDDFGPQLPSAADISTSNSNPPPDSTTHDVPTHPATKQETKRDEWMLLPPSQGDWSSRVDPTKLKSRGFSTGKGAKAPAAKGEGGGTWTETPEEKRRRLQNEVMGVQNVAVGRRTAGPAVGPAEPDDTHDKETARKVEEYNQKSRNTALYKQHKKNRGDEAKEKEDDPSARPFDKEKDIRGPSKISHAQQREMVAKASDFGSRFSKGKYL